MLVREIMVTPIITVHEDCSLEEAAKIMLERNVGGLPVVNERGELCGIVTDRISLPKGKVFRSPSIVSLKSLGSGCRTNMSSVSMKPRAVGR